MNVLIVEDEGIAADRLARLLGELQPDLRVLEVLDTVKSAAAWLRSNQSPDLLFFDIHLADGSSFEIFEQVSVDCPVIFTTAYDQYAIKAFEVNSIDYLLKPIVLEKLERALDKFEHLSKAANPMIDVSQLQQMLGAPAKSYKERFVVKIGEHIKTIPTDAIACLYSEEGSTYLQHEEGKKFIIDFTLDQLTELLDPSVFFRVNRKFIVQMKAIRDIVSYSNSRLKIVLPHWDNNELIVSRERVAAFKAWLDG
ncbi:two component transcriptional regulator, LytTR family [Reichenbachiella agariperforans]|uniref:Two component transcriptional regulator, LytTR family n=1 Tax=Reichenbachiella agariperforans TaxID=156994 RepID=A0A1M6KWH1_REIAG|nr:LytTR family DNA-binding domain-containing protein [Reichenbachiella agariperforans]SHJ63230.1 two component transcriptional regulator, LytTR family [Reichenbachiella agariperforans]